MSKTHISNNSLTNLLFSAARHTTLRQGILESISFPRSVGVHISRASKFPRAVAQLFYRSLLSYLQPSSPPPGPHFFSFVLPSALPTHLLSFFSFRNDLPFLTPTAGFIDLILDIKKKKKQDSSANVYVIGKLKVYTEEKGDWQRGKRKSRRKKLRKGESEQRYHQRVLTVCRILSVQPQNNPARQLRPSSVFQ